MGVIGLPVALYSLYVELFVLYFPIFLPYLPYIFSNFVRLIGQPLRKSLNPMASLGLLAPKSQVAITITTYFSSHF